MRSRDPASRDEAIGDLFELIPPVPGEIFVADERRCTGELRDPRSVASIEEWGGLG